LTGKKYSSEKRRELQTLIVHTIVKKEKYSKEGRGVGYLI
jgi:hypothetical protein